MNDLEKTASQFLGKEGSAKLHGKIGNIQQLASTEDGKAVEAMLKKDANRLTDALQSGDADELKRALGGILNSDAGSRIVSELSKLMEN